MSVPNTTIDTATEVTFDASGQVVIPLTLAGDEDTNQWFTFVMPTDAVYFVARTNDSPNPADYLYIEAYKEDGTTYKEYLDYSVEDGTNAHLGIAATGGTRYYVYFWLGVAGDYADPASYPSGITLTISTESAHLPIPSPPANDSSSSAIPLDLSSPGTMAYDNTGATADQEDADWGWAAYAEQPLRSIWYSFTVDEPVIAIINFTPDGAADKDIVQARIAYSGTTSPRQDWTYDELGYHRAKQVKVVCQPGEIYHLEMVFRYGNPTDWSQGVLSWTTAPQPEHTELADPLDVAVDDRMAVAEFVPTELFSAYRAYRITSPGDGGLVFAVGDETADASGLDSYVYVYTQNADGTFAYIAGKSERSISAPTYGVTVAAKKGQQFVVRVRGLTFGRIALRWGLTTDVTWDAWISGTVTDSSSYMGERLYYGNPTNSYDSFATASKWGYSRCDDDFVSESNSSTADFTAVKALLDSGGGQTKWDNVPPPADGNAVGKGKPYPALMATDIGLADVYGTVGYQGHNLFGPIHYTDPDGTSHYVTFAQNQLIGHYTVKQYTFAPDQIKKDPLYTDPYYPLTSTLKKSLTTRAFEWENGSGYAPTILWAEVTFSWQKWSYQGGMDNEIPMRNNPMALKMLDAGGDDSGITTWKTPEQLAALPVFASVTTTDTATKGSAPAQRIVLDDDVDIDALPATRTFFGVTTQMTNEDPIDLETQLAAYNHGFMFWHLEGSPSIRMRMGRVFPDYRFGTYVEQPTTLVAYPDLSKPEPVAQGWSVGVITIG